MLIGKKDISKNFKNDITYDIHRMDYDISKSYTPDDFLQCAL